eukprot:scpid42032/ scgid2058/ Fidgetin-like protein 1
MDDKDKALLSWWQKAVFTYDSTENDPASRLEAARLLATEARHLTLTSGSETCPSTVSCGRHDRAYSDLADKQPLKVPNQKWSSSLNVERAARTPALLRLREAKALPRLTVPPQFGKKPAVDNTASTEELRPSYSKHRTYPRAGQHAAATGPESGSGGGVAGDYDARDLNKPNTNGLFSSHGSSSAFPGKRKPPYQSVGGGPAGLDSEGPGYNQRPPGHRPDPQQAEHRTSRQHAGMDAANNGNGQGAYSRHGGARSTPGTAGRAPPPQDVDDSNPFITAHDQLVIDQNNKKNGGYAYGSNKRSLGTTRRPGPGTKFVPPVAPADDGGATARKKSSGASSAAGNDSKSAAEELSKDERLSGLEPRMIELIMNEIMDHGPPITWNDIAGLEFAKKTIQEIVVWPMLRPDIFTGLRGPPKGMLLFGPPGTGKTLIGKCIASQAGATFFSISASSLTSKWVGEGEKMVRALFGVARCHQPAVIFIDEIDSLLSLRSDSEHESSRRIKTEFLVQLDGATTISEDRLLVVGATNRPQEIDEAARRRLVKRLYIPLPDCGARQQIVLRLLSKQMNSVTDDEASIIAELTDGYSGADMTELCREAALGPIRSIRVDDIQCISADQVRPISHSDFVDAVKHVRASVDQKDLGLYIDWNKRFGSGTW